MTHGSLFSGIGGFDLAAEWMGWENKFHCEWNEFGQKVLKYYWPGAESFSDITKTDFTKYANSIDILTGGFPCQPFSVAGERQGVNDPRHLFPQMLRAIREISPRWVVGENVRGLTNWNGGVVFDEVQADLEAEGYEITPFLLPACGVNAPHRRDRIWFIAFKNTDGIRWASKQRQSQPCERRFGVFGTGNNERVQTDNDNVGFTSDTENLRHSSGKKNDSGNAGEFYQDQQRQHQADGREPGGRSGNVTNSQRLGQQGSWRSERPGNKKAFGNGKASWSDNDGGWPTQSPLCDGNDGISERLDSVTFSKWRQESIKGGGNAIVPQVAFQIFKAIEQYDRTTNERL
jgi:DNA (cytosine-5)-methyltransferase 1